ncbi:MULTISPECIES: TrmH family RNA methyltransferase [unclassified Motilimonas]|uniref:TrmH family RNA methyltransferase n=1 Tax=Motilimonas TaxID=1914248 RepID=UPI001E5548C4|nr:MULTISPECIES: TrmH family RNA methyltransferase [unclassified Motilimonas]MCE0555682.1 TrmH family RNA methyltransferase [Motilimonas sp. E26]MDO6527704.1 TrmH family RNA methyltransferase [Motilimonas sp. 1_MG-2023]
MTKRTDVTIGLTNPKSATNVGAVMRAAGCFQVDRVIYSGERYDRTLKLNTDTKKIRSSIPLTQQNCLLDNKPEEVKVVCVDLVVGATPLPEFEHPEKALYIFGPEDGTISQQVIDQADAVVYIPTIGCLNLAASVNVLLYDRSTKLAQLKASDELIHNSRDRNNKVKVKKAE